MYCDVLDLHHFLRPRLLVHCNLLDIVQHLITLQEFSKHGIFSVQMRRRRKRDEELATVRIGALVRHADYPAGVVSQGGADLILEELVGGVVDGRGDLRLGV